MFSNASTTTPDATPKRSRRGKGTTAKTKRGYPAATSDIAVANSHLLNQHALTLLSRWALSPDDHQLHLLTLASPIRFASQTETIMLKKMRTEWTPSAVIDYFKRVEGFEDLFLSQTKPLEAVQVILAAVDIIAEPHRFLPPFRLE